MTVELSPLAERLWALVTERPHRLTIDEAKADLRCSKTALADAIQELVDNRLVITTEEEP